MAVQKGGTGLAPNTVPRYAFTRRLRSMPPLVPRYALDQPYTVSLTHRPVLSVTSRPEDRAESRHAVAGKRKQVALGHTAQPLHIRSQLSLSKITQNHKTIMRHLIAVFTFCPNLSKSNLTAPSERNTSSNNHDHDFLHTDGDLVTHDFSQSDLVWPQSASTSPSRYFVTAAAVYNASILSPGGGRSLHCEKGRMTPLVPLR